jgi:hypothetical protein
VIGNTCDILLSAEILVLTMRKTSKATRIEPASTFIKLPENKPDARAILEFKRDSHTKKWVK